MDQAERGDRCRGQRERPRKTRVDQRLHVEFRPVGRPHPAPDGRLNASIDHALLPSSNYHLRMPDRSLSDPAGMRYP
jgi:hypothetical protein